MHQILLVGCKSDKMSYVKSLIANHTKEVLEASISKMENLDHTDEACITLRLCNLSNSKYLETVENRNEKKEIRIQCGWIPRNMELICEGRDDEGLSDRNQFQKYVFVCSFPYETEIMKKLIGQGIQIRQKDLNTELLYVIYKRNLRTGATDLDVKDDVIKEIKKEYNKKIMVEVYDEKSSRKQVFMSHMNLVHCISWDYTEKCKNEIKRIEDRVEEKKKDYDNIERPAIEKEGYGDPQRMEQSVKSFRKLKTGMDIMEQYLSNYITSKMYKRGENIILNFYRRIFSSDILLWSIDEEYEIMKKEMKKMLERKVLSCNKNEIIPADEMEFRKVLSRTNIHTDFARLLDEYYRNDIKEYIFDRIQQKMKKLREYLDFNEEENE